MQTCKGYCEESQHIPNRREGIWDKENISYCAICSVYFITKENKCSCCGTLLRKNPNNKKSKERLRNG